MLRDLLKIIGESALFSRKTPRFWHENGFIPQLLIPFAVIYFILKRIFSSRAKPQKFEAKIICIGNAIAGGAGKTPAAIAVYKELQKQKPAAKICFVSTAFRAKIYGPEKIDISKHTVADVGDEAFLLASHGNAVICKNRVKAVEYAISLGFTYIILDDGLHDKRIHKDITFLMIDGNYGFGNGLILPCGPLRDRLDYAVEGTDHIILIGEDKTKAVEQVNAFTKKKYPVIRSFIDTTTKIDETNIYVAFAGIGRPQKFFDTLKNDMKLVVAETVEFPDHHTYNESDFETLNNIAASQKAKLITTEKDFVKLPKEFAANVECLKIELQFDDGQVPQILNKL